MAAGSERPPERGGERSVPESSVTRLFEGALWGSRLIVLVAVVFGLLLALGAFYLATVDVFYFLGYLGDYADLSLGTDEREDLRASAITAIVKAVDGYLIAAILIIFALGLYELFISKLDPAERSETIPRLLLIRSLDELKERIASLVLLVLVIEFFQRALQLEYRSPLDLLYFATGVLLVSGALYLGSRKPPKDQEPKGS
ncbi:YqhA family protein [Rubrobacter marinus]|uniref:YqhA family protein n=1 Tax=Rubrobacter marinus TaxID=2653852 RepID=UPI001A9D5E51|nr:YqhA family protein [Rubrobacter marinus]